MDDFKKEQQKFCVDYSPGSSPKWGCPCCRCFRSIRLFKRATRKWAKGKLRTKTSRFLRNWEDYY